MRELRGKKKEKRIMEIYISLFRPYLNLAAKSCSNWVWLYKMVEFLPKNKVLLKVYILGQIMISCKKKKYKITIYKILYIIFLQLIWNCRKMFIFIDQTLICAKSIINIVTLLFDSRFLTKIFGFLREFNFIHKKHDI